MFRAEIHQLAQGPTLKLQGRLVGPWAEQARDLFSMDSVPKGLVIDLTDLSYVDSVGEQVLQWFRSIGAKFVAQATYADSMCEQLNLPLKDELPVSV